MASYIGKVQIGSNDPVLIGSTSYGICYTNADVTAKNITANTTSPAITGDYVNTNYDNLIRGSTIHIKFINGNTVTSNATLQVGTLTTTQEVIGNFTCPANTVISFTLDENQKWIVNDNVDTNTEYVFKTEYNSTTGRVITENDIKAAAEKGIITNISSNTASTDLPTVAAVVSYVQDQTGGLAGLTGAMHFRGITTTDLTDINNISTSSVVVNSVTMNAISGDVVLLNEQEYVWTGSTWTLLGDEGSYALKSSTGTVVDSVTFTTNTVPTLTTAAVTASKVTITSGSAASLDTTAVSIPNVTTPGTATTASVTGGILVFNIGTDTVLGTAISVTSVNSFTANSPTVVTATNVEINSVSSWNAGTAASLTATTASVVVPG